MLVVSTLSARKPTSRSISVEPASCDDLGAGASDSLASRSRRSCRYPAFAASDFRRAASSSWTMMNAPAAAVVGVQLHHGVGRRSRAREEVEHDVVRRPVQRRRCRRCEQRDRLRVVEDRLRAEESHRISGRRMLSVCPHLD